MTETNNIAEFEEVFLEGIYFAQQFYYATIARELQIEAVEKLVSVKEIADTIKTEKIERMDEEAANKILCFEYILDCLIYELQMWIAIKDSKAEAAWGCLVEAQTSASSALHTHKIAFDLNIENHLERLRILERILFPPQTFMSIGMVVKHSFCSICKADYGKCDHIVGKVYLGQTCIRVIDSAEPLEISIVNEPANRHCRMTSIEGRDTLTGLITNKNL